MLQEIITYLQCPYCQTTFHLEKKVESSNPECVFAILKCQCDVFPVFDGIAYLIRDETLKNRQVVELLKERSFYKAFKILLQERKKLAWIYWCLYILKTRKVVFKKSWLKHIFGLFSLLDRSSKDWYSYCFNRNNRVVFKICEASAGFVQPNTLCLDCGSGIGHFLETINSIQEPKKNFGIDYSFKLLYLARLFIAKNNILICSDLNYPIPLKKNVVKTIYFNDCFMYIFNQKGVFQHAKQVLKKTGLLIINHLHLPDKYNLGSGYTIPVSLLKTMSKDFDGYVNSDKNIFSQLRKNIKITYSSLQNFSPSKTDRSVSMVFALIHKKSSERISVISKKVNLKKIDYIEELDFKSS